MRRRWNVKLWIGAISFLVLLAPMHAFGMPLFENVSNYPVGTMPQSSAFGDFNEDGRQDLAVANYNDGNGSISILLGDGEGGLTNTAAIPVIKNPESIAVGDFNHDSTLDLAVANGGPASDTFYYVSILEGNGDGSFAAAAPVKVDHRPVSVAFGDFDNDGTLDLSVATVSNVSILFGDALGGFADKVSLPVGSNPSSIVVEDFDGDGNMDSAVTSQDSNHVSIVLGNGDRTFQPVVNYPVGASPRSIALGDFNGDMKKELVITYSRSNRISILQGNTDGTFQPAQDINLGGSIEAFSTAIGDFNGDGKQDLAVANFTSFNVSILMGIGDGAFQPAIHYAVEGVAYSAAIADLDLDGRMDLAIVNYLPDGALQQVSVLLGRGDGTFRTPGNYGVGSEPIAVAAADYNGDGHADAAVANSDSDTVSLLKGNGNGTFQSAVDLPVGGSVPVAIAAGTFNGDPVHDLVTVNRSSNTISVLIGNGDGTFLPAVSYAVGVSPRSVAIGDFNGDGKADLAVTNAASNTVSLLTGKGDGTFEAAASHNGDPNVSNPRAIAAIDFNGDGNTDLAIANYGSKKVYILSGNGDGTFQAGNNVYETDDSPLSLAIGDFDRDTKPDILVTEVNPGNVNEKLTLLMNQGGLGFSKEVVATFEDDATPVSVTVGDFNGDQKLDAAVANNFLNYITIMKGNGDGTFQTPLQYGTGNSPVFVAAADYNGDGKSDVVVANRFSDSVTLFTSLPFKWKLRLMSPTYSVNENSPSVTASVYREGDSQGVASVDYSTYDGNAVAGVDYTAATGTLTFQPGQTSQSFTVPILNDAVFKGDRTFQVKLSHPSEDAALSTPATSIVTIVEDEERPVVPPIYTPYTPPSTSLQEIDIIVDGVKQYKLASSSTEQIGDLTATVIKVYNDKVMENLDKSSSRDIIIPVTANTNAIRIELNGKLIKMMEGKDGVIEVRTERAVYTLPASQVQLASILAQLAPNAKLEDIIIHIQISDVSKESAQLMNDAAKAGDFTIAVKPIEFEVTLSYGDTKVVVDSFRTYVERNILLSEGIDPSRITTGVVLNPDGTVSHVPTKVIVQDGNSYVRISSLSNSIYSVIWNPRTFADVEKHWSKADVNDMASRLIIQGVSKQSFQPNSDITRAEFVAIMTRALGLKAGAGTGAFKDIQPSDWYSDAVRTAAAYGLVSGYSDGTFRPNQTITRAEAAAILAQALEFTKLNVTLSDGEVSSLLGSFTDGTAVADWAKKYIALAIHNGIVKGDHNNIMPADNVTRAQAAAMVRRMLQKTDLINE